MGDLNNNNTDNLATTITWDRDTYRQYLWYGFVLFTCIVMAIGIVTVCLTSPKEPGKTCSFILKSEAPSLSADSRPHSIAIGHFNNDDLPDIVVANSGTNNIDVLLRYDIETFANPMTYSTGSGSVPYAVAIGDFNHDKRLDIVVANFGTNNIGIFLGIDNGTFTSQTTFSTGSSRPLWIAAGDFNNDTALDIAVANYGTNNIGILLGYNNGIFATQITFSTGYDSLPMSLIVNDFNNDDHLDIAVANYGTNNIGILLGYNDGTFATQIILTTGTNSHPMSIATGKFNNDTHVDIVVVNYGTDNVAVFLGYGNATFTVAMKYSTGNNSSPRSVAVGDFDNDNHLDFMVANYGTQSLGIYFGYGNGTFAPQTMYMTSYDSNPYLIATEDFNNDNRLDIAAINYDDNYIDILLTYRNYSFFSEKTYTTSGTYSNPASIVMADLNNDSRLDIIVANSWTNNVGIFIGYGNGTFSAQTTYSTGSNSGPYSLAVNDFNNDRRLDIVVANYFSSNIEIFLGAGDGTFSSQTFYSTGNNSQPYCVIVDDFNKDNRWDIAVANRGTDNVGIFVGYSDGTFSMQTTYSTESGSGPCWVASGDLNNDGWPDIVVANYWTKNVGVFFGKGNNTFSNQMTYSTGNYSYPQSVAVGDFNNDSRLDIAVVNSGSDNLGIFFGNINGTFSSQATFSTGIGSSPRSVAVGDFNNDRQLDIVVANNNNDSVYVFIGYRNGSFVSQKFYSTGIGSKPYGVAVGDLNNDGWSDIAATNYATSNIAVFLGYAGIFTSPNIYLTNDPSYSSSVAVNDFNSDGRLDMAVANYGSNTIDVFFGYGDGTFSSQTTYSTGTGSAPNDIVVADFNNDSQVDIAVANYLSNTIGIFLSNRNGTFFNQITYFTGSYSNPRAVAVGDFNNDSKLDIAVANYNSNNFGVFFGYGDGTFSNRANFPTGDFSAPFDIAVGDLNNDHRLDVIIVNYYTNNVGIFLGYGDGSFSDETTYSTGIGSTPCGVTVSDLNNDSRADIVVAICYSFCIGILLGYGDGSFSTLTIYSTGSRAWPNSIVTGDWNNDDRVDIAVTNRDTNNIGVFLGQGDGTFLNQRTYSTGMNSSPTSIAFGDFNNDSLQDIVVAHNNMSKAGIFLAFTYINGVLEDNYSTGSSPHPQTVGLGDFNSDNLTDIAIANYGLGNVAIFFGYTNNTFSMQTTFTTGSLSFPTSIAINDLNNDSKLDIAISNSGAENVGVLYGHGNGSFMSLATYSTGVNFIPQSVAIADFNNDGKLDIAVASDGTDHVNVLLRYDSGAFRTPIIYSTGSDSNPKSVAVGDFNKDGWLDFAVTIGNSHSIGIFVALGNGTFSRPVTYPTGSRSNPWAIAVADLNNDSHLDIVVTNYWTFNIGVFLGSSNATFSPQTTYSTGSNSAPISVAIGDINNDSHLDIVVANPWADNIGIFLGYSDGTFSNQTSYTTGGNSYPYCVAIGDFNNDRQSDVVVANFKMGNVCIFLGNRDGTLSIQTTYSTGSNSAPESIVIGDFNSDSQLDIAVANYAADTVSVLFGYGDGTFSSQTTYSTGSGSGPSVLAVGDFNNDNQLDIAITNYNSNNLGILLGCTNGTFFSQLTYSTGNNSQPSGITLGDFNRDGRLDILTASFGTNNVYLFLGYISESFLSAPSYSTGLSSRPAHIAIGDFNKDTLLDIVVANNGTNNIMVLSGSGFGTFIRQMIYLTGDDSHPCWVAVADFNNDSRLDIVVANSGTSHVGIFLGSDNDTFSSQTTYFTGLRSQPYSVAALDFDGDGQLDIAVANYGSNSVGILLGYGNGSFASQMIFATGFNSRPFGIVVGDVNRDNFIDVIVPNNEYGNINIVSKVC